MNETARRKKGDVREDGFKFWSYHKKREYWVSPEQFEVLTQKMRISNARYEKANRKKRNARNRVWKGSRRERMRAEYKRWYDANREYNRQRLNEWLRANPAFTRARNARRRARENKAIPPDAWHTVIDRTFEIAHRVSECLGIKHHVDHIIPLKADGSHCHRNLQVLPEKWNLKKLKDPNYPLPDCYRTDGYAKKVA